MSYNPKHPTANQKIDRFGQLDGARREETILINAESLPHLYMVQNKVRYGFGKVLLKVYYRDQVVNHTHAYTIGDSTVAKVSKATQVSVVEQAAGGTSKEDSELLGSKNEDDVLVEMQETINDSNNADKSSPLIVSVVPDIRFA